MLGMRLYLILKNNRFNRYMVECEYINIFHAVLAKSSFNRYMVECEYSLSKISFALSLVLIDTWWNVNTNKLGAGTEEVVVLIDTWWNVNQRG